EGAAVVAGHVDTLTEVTAMAQLTDVPVGAEVRVERADGSVQRYRTESVQHVHKTSLAEADLFRRTGEPVLHLVTCGGEWLEEIGDDGDNGVPRAVPVPWAVAGGARRMTGWPVSTRLGTTRTPGHRTTARDHDLCPTRSPSTMPTPPPEWGPE